MVPKHLVSALAVSALALMCAPAASAARPTITPVPAEPETGRFCPDFDVFINPVINKEKAITFSTGRPSSPDTSSTRSQTCRTARRSA